jgi:glycerol-3-phosphate dehydrogenase (NAD(P)+)
MKIGIIGAGAWGTALAQAFAKGGKDVILCAREEEIVASVNGQHENALFLPGIELDPKITATGEPMEAAACGVVLLVPPAQYLRAACASIKDIEEGKPVVICAKGIELESGKTMTGIAAEIIPQATLAVLTGPTFASEIAKGLPSAVTVASSRLWDAENICAALATRTLRPYASDDLIGAQIGGAVKNVIAIACGIIAGRGLGDSARAALMTRGLAEIARLAEKLGARRETLMGMCGVGDLMLTASSMQSRNYSLGFQLGQGRTLDDIMAERQGKSVTEGVTTAKALMVMAEKYGVDMPVAQAVYKCVGEGKPIDATIAEIMDRPLKGEAA